MDAVTGEGGRGQMVDELRSELSAEKLVSFFDTPDRLAALVSAAVQQVASPQGSAGAIDVARDAEIVGANILGDIAGVKGYVHGTSAAVDVLRGGS